MKPELKAIVESIFNVELLESPACRSCRAMVYAYIDAEFDNEDAARFPAVAEHLDTLPHVKRYIQS